MNPLVSIIIPVYNKAAFVAETLDSVLGQSYPNIELVLVNDGSRDGSKLILEAYQSKFPDKVILIDQPNGGVSKATNAGIQASRGEYIQFLDADDLISPDKIKTQINLLHGKGNRVLSTCAFVCFQNSIEDLVSLNYSVFQGFPSGIEVLFQFWEKQEMLAISSYLTHRSLIEKAGAWNESLSINQDGEFFMRVLLSAGEVVYDPDSLVYYRNPGPSNVSQQKSKQAFSSLLDSFQLYEKYTLEIDNTNRARKALNQVYQKFIYDCYPNYPHLVDKAEALMKQLEVSEKTYIGGPKFQMLSRYLGFKIALRLKRILKSKF